MARRSSGRKGRSNKRRRTLRRYEVPSKSLEEFTLGREAVPDEGLKVDFRNKGGLVVDRMRRVVKRRRATRAKASACLRAATFDCPV